MEQLKRDSARSTSYRSRFLHHLSVSLFAGVVLLTISAFFGYPMGLYLLGSGNAWYLLRVRHNSRQGSQQSGLTRERSRESSSKHRSNVHVVGWRPGRDSNPPCARLFSVRVSHG